MKKSILITLSILFMMACNNQPKLTYPAATTDDITRSYYGEEIPEPYAWLENDTTAQTAAWVEAENAVTQQYLSKIGFRDNLRQRLTELNDYPKQGAPSKKHGYFYFFKNDGLQNQSVLYRMKSLDDEPELLLDPNTLSDDGTVALQSTSITNDGQYMAYVISRSGSDWQEIYVLDLATKTQTTDHIQWAKFTSVQWQNDGFYYNAYDAPVEGKAYSNVNENQKIYYHKIGTPQSDDKLFYVNPKYPKRFYRTWIDDNQTVMFLEESGNNVGNRLFIKDLRTKNDFVEIAFDDNYEYMPVEVIGEEIYFLTNYNAPKYRLAKAKITDANVDKWTDVLPENENVLTAVDFTNNRIIAIYDQDAANHAFVYSLDGKLQHEVALPTLGTVGFSCNIDEPEIFYSFTSFTFPASVYKYNIDENTSELFIKPEVKFNPDDYTTEQIFFPSKDGTKVPMFLTYKKGLKLNGKNPLLLYGYGGFNITYRPSFSTARIPFLENGGIYVLANIRGGAEYGEEWHLAGTKLQKQNVFDDFIAASEYLIANKYTDNKHLAIIGGSNGGLLVGAVVNQRPDLFAVAIPQVGVMDMLRYHLFTIGWNWAADYGRSDDSEEMFRYLYAYSPIHNIKNDGTPYPAILVTTGDHDDRVVPAHSFKYAATLQAANTGDAPKLIRIDTKAGHGSGKPIAKIIDEQADIYSFIMYNLRMTPKFNNTKK